MNVYLWNARARNGHVEATLNHPFPAQAAADATQTRTWQDQIDDLFVAVPPAPADDVGGDGGGAPPRDAAADDDDDDDGGPEVARPTAAPAEAPPEAFDDAPRPEDDDGAFDDVEVFVIDDAPAADEFV